MKILYDYIEDNSCSATYEIPGDCFVWLTEGCWNSCQEDRAFINLYTISQYRLRVLVEDLQKPREPIFRDKDFKSLHLVIARCTFKPRSIMLGAMLYYGNEYIDWPEFDLQAFEDELIMDGALL